jgi:hypothetical protein
MDITQIVIIISILAITTILVLVGISIINLLKELKTTIFKTNLILDDAKVITSSVAQPVSTLAEVFAGVKTGIATFNTFFNKNKKD